MSILYLNADLTKLPEDYQVSPRVRFADEVSAAFQGRFPTDIHHRNQWQQDKNTTILVQVINVEDISTSKYNQAERIRMETDEGAGNDRLRGKGRPTIQNGDMNSLGENNDEENGDFDFNGDLGNRFTNKKAYCKLVLQDRYGTVAYGVELDKVLSIHPKMALGCKFILKNVTSIRGVLLLDGSNVRFLGGCIL
ncbi:hypothetical protein NADFUDRAFT_51163 [Nadsonia fulvescens var. elongata DSM 6958]|uniref:RecQ mediated genome instability protein 1 OB-fold domain-containing protein n=1 Tax=Nadsonia fulvescens var. elongata DSM 6958 TaxID=857566 RepID=A0A1E3PL14_9ASCO|nr:hypothetical protein NADFUDRAFT_51163 [Nadsonia fulvescens var. elongata DSM 6958]